MEDEEEIQVADPDADIFRVRLPDRGDIPYLVLSPAPPPELLNSDTPVSMPADRDTAAALLAAPEVQDATSPLAKFLVGLVWAKLEAAFVKPLALESRIEIEDPDGRPWGHVLVRRGGHVDLFDAGGRRLAGWPPA